MTDPPRKETPAPTDAIAARLPHWAARQWIEPQNRIPHSGRLRPARWAA
jgi:hypothetical protein